MAMSARSASNSPTWKNIYFLIILQLPSRLAEIRHLYRFPPHSKGQHHMSHSNEVQMRSQCQSKFKTFFFE